MNKKNRRNFFWTYQKCYYCDCQRAVEVAGQRYCYQCCRKWETRQIPDSPIFRKGEENCPKCGSAAETKGVDGRWMCYYCGHDKQKKDKTRGELLIEELERREG